MGGDNQTQLVGIPFANVFSLNPTTSVTTSYASMSVPRARRLLAELAEKREKSMQLVVSPRLERLSHP